MKKCFKCKKVKELGLFYKHRQMRDGHLNKCIACTKKDVRRRYYDPESRERIRGYERKRFKNSERKAKLLNYQRLSRKKHPNKAMARRKVGNYKRDGKLLQEPCTVCGDEKSQAHHPDYRKPLDVQWLCFRHHREEHGQLVG